MASTSAAVHFSKLDDSPMFRKKIQALEEEAELLKERCLKFYKGCRKYTEGLGEAYDGDVSFATSLEMFGGGHNDPISIAFGGPVMTKFTIALREIGTYKEVLRSQVEHILNDRLLHFADNDLHDIKDARKRFDRACVLYDQAREKYLSLKKGTRAEVANVLEDELHSARNSFEQARFVLISALSNIEAKKRFEFLEAVGGTMDAHLRYFKQGYELLHQMEPYINQVLGFAQQSRERANCEQAALLERMQEFKKQIDRESMYSNGSFDSSNGDGIQAVGRSSHKVIEAVMQTALKGKVEIIRQGYLSKRSSNLRGDWKRRFFVLDSRGMLYYYRKQFSRTSGAGSHHASHRGHTSSDHGSGLLSRLFSSHYLGGMNDEKAVARHTVNLLTSTIKVDAEQSDLRFCFRIISPSKNYTLQAESAMDQMDWIEKITGVIASLLSAQSPEQSLPSPTGSNYYVASESSYDSCSDFDQLSVDESSTNERSIPAPHSDRTSRGSQQLKFNVKHEKPIEVLRKVDGNDMCADCGAPEPDWASLNLGILVCIECSGVHRNLGVHISKVRSLTLDVRVWEPSVMNLFQSLGNAFANSIWEDFLPSSSNGNAEDDSGFCVLRGKNHMSSTRKPKHKDPISVKEKFIQAKYADKVFVAGKSDQMPAQEIWESVHTNNIKAVYRHIVTSNADLNVVYSDNSVKPCLTLAKVMQLQDQPTTLHKIASSIGDTQHKISSTNETDECQEGWSLLHLACQTAEIGMIELLLQYGADVNATDQRGMTPLHHCVLKGKQLFVKLLLSRGADPQAADKNGKTPVLCAIELGTAEGEEILLLLEDANR